MKTGIKEICPAEAAPSKLPCFIYNRFDLWEPRPNYVILEIEGFETYLEVLLNDRCASLGCWMLPVDNDLFNAVSKFVFKKYKNIKHIDGTHNLCKIRRSSPYNHYSVILPKNEEEIDEKTSPHHLKSFRRNVKRLTAAYGEMSFRKLKIEDIPNDASEFYFSEKLFSMNRNYSMTMPDYAKKYHVTHCYLLSFGTTLAAIYLSCEQTKIPYIENLAFNHELEKYSVGTIGYRSFLVRLGQGGFDVLYLGGGAYQYKARFGGSLVTTYQCIKFRNGFYFIRATIHRMIAKCLRTLIKNERVLKLIFRR